MSSAWIIVLTFAATSTVVTVACFLIDYVWLRDRTLLNERLNEVVARKEVAGNRSVFKDRQSLFVESWEGRLDGYIEQAGLSSQLRRLVNLSLLAAVFVSLIAVVVTRRWWAAPVGCLPSLIGLPLYVFIKRRLRMERLRAQLPAALGTISRAVKAGQTVIAAFRLVADELEPPISEEFRCCFEQQNLGMPHDTSLRMLARRTGIMDLQILVVALLVQARTGGNLIGLLDDLTMTVQKRLKFQQRVRALTSEGRMQAAVLIVLPTLAFAGICVLAPDYAATLVARPGILVVTAAAQLVGAVWIRQYMNIEY